jgi:hypothetical protein
MKNICQLPLLGLAFGAMLTTATAAWAEGEVTTGQQTETQMDTGAGTTLDTDATAESMLDTSALKEIEDENVMYDGMTVGEIEGTDVYVGEEDIGEIEEVLGDDSGQVQAYILSVEDGIFDLDATKFVVPVDQFTFDAENGRFSTQLTQVDIEGYETWE